MSKFCPNCGVALSVHGDSPEQENSVCPEKPAHRDIQAECHSDDRLYEVVFDAKLWFDQASPQAIVDLIACGCRGDYPADDVAIFMADIDEDVAQMFRYLEILNGRVRDCIGFECSVNPDDIEKWMKTLDVEANPEYACVFEAWEKSKEEERI